VFRELDGAVNIGQFLLRALNAPQGLLQLNFADSAHLAQRPIVRLGASEHILRPSVSMLQPLQAALRQVVIQFQIEGHRATPVHPMRDIGRELARGDLQPGEGRVMVCCQKHDRATVPAAPQPAFKSSVVHQEAAQLLAAAWMAQLAQCLGLDLADALARDVELLADFLERVIGIHVDAEAHA